MFSRKFMRDPPGCGKVRGPCFLRVQGLAWLYSTSSKTEQIDFKTFVINKEKINSNRLSVWKSQTDCVSTINSIW